MSADYPHAPGSPEAVADGCLCPVLDNAHGRGCGYVDAASGLPIFIFSFDCPHHADSKPKEDDVQFMRDLSGPAYGAATRLTETIA